MTPPPQDQHTEKEKEENQTCELRTKNPNPTRQNIKSHETTETSDKLPAMDRLTRRFQNYTAPCITHNPNQNPVISDRRISDEVDQEYTADERDIAAKFY